MNRRDLELLSSYLDGQLKPSDSARLEARLSKDPDLRAVLEDLRATRSLLRQLPMRKAPRNFTLTPAMVGKNPPLPRAYPAFKFMATVASFLLFFTLGVNFLAPQLASSPAFGMGGGAEQTELFSAQEAPPAAVPEAPATEAPLEEAFTQMVPAPTDGLATEDNARELESPAGEEGLEGEAPVNVPVARPVPPAWQILLAAIALLGVLGMLLMRQAAASRWRRRS